MRALPPAGNYLILFGAFCIGLANSDLVAGETGQVLDFAAYSAGIYALAYGVVSSITTGIMKISQ